MCLSEQPISEDRTLTAKYSELKLQSHFLHASPAFLTATPLPGAAGSPFTNTSSIYTTQLHDAASGTNFYVVRQASNNWTTPATFALSVNTRALGTVSVPRYGGAITLAGRESKVLVTDYAFGSHQVAYATAEVSSIVNVEGK